MSLYKTVAKKGKINVIFAEAALVEKKMTAEATPEHFDKTFNINARAIGLTEFIEIPQRGHSLTIDAGWREVAESVLKFVTRFK